jgi:hypothetical protein
MRALVEGVSPLETPGARKKLTNAPLLRARSSVHHEASVLLIPRVLVLALTPRDVLKHEE